MEFLKRRATRFLELAEEMVQRGDYIMAMFFIEQFFQLSLKYLLYVKYGEFPKTHSLKMLLELMKDDRFTEFYRENLDLIRDIELSYVASRYFDVEYSEASVKRALDLAKKFKEMI